MSILPDGSTEDMTKLGEDLAGASASVVEGRERLIKEWTRFPIGSEQQRILHDVPGVEAMLRNARVSLAYKKQQLATLAALKSDAGSDRMRDSYAREIGDVLNAMDADEKEIENLEGMLNDLWERFDEAKGPKPMQITLRMAAE